MKKCLFTFFLISSFLSVKPIFRNADNKELSIDSSAEWKSEVGTEDSVREILKNPDLDMEEIIRVLISYFEESEKEESCPRFNLKENCDNSKVLFEVAKDFIKETDFFYKIISVSILRELVKKDCERVCDLAVEVMKELVNSEDVKFFPYVLFLLNELLKKGIVGEELTSIIKILNIRLDIKNEYADDSCKAFLETLMLSLDFINHRN